MHIAIKQPCTSGLLIPSWLHHYLTGVLIAVILCVWIPSKVSHAYEQPEALHRLKYLKDTPFKQKLSIKHHNSKKPHPEHLKKKNKSPEALKIKRQFEKYAKNIKAKNRAIEKYNAGLRKKIASLNKKIDTHNDTIQKCYVRLLKQAGTGDTVLTSFVKKYNIKAHAANRLIDSGIMPGKLPEFTGPAPHLVLRFISLEDSGPSANNNGILEAGESADLVFNLKNTGTGDALGVYVKALHHAACLQTKPSPAMSFAAGSSGKVRMGVSLAKNAQDGTAQLKVIPREALGNDGSPLSLQLPIGAFRLPDLTIAAVRLVDGTDPNSPGYHNHQITKGESAELILTILNNDTRTAKNATVTLSAGQPGIVLYSDRAVIGHVPPGELLQTKLSFVVPHSYGQEMLNIDLVIRQGAQVTCEEHLTFPVHAEPTVVSQGTQEQTVQEINFPPRIFIYKPDDNSTTTQPSIKLVAEARDNEAIADVTLQVNGETLQDARDIAVVPKDEKSRSIIIDVPLRVGVNTIGIAATDIRGARSAEESVIVTRRQAVPGKTHVISIGINGYTSVPRLNYAVNDARSFMDYAVSHLGVLEQHSVLLTDREASKRSILRVIGDELFRNAGRNDTVIIFFAGHGASSPDTMSRDPDNIEKYLLPFDVETNALFSTAIKMDDIAAVIDRLQAERVVFIADTCYSGASGGRTLAMNGFRSTYLSNDFLDRLAKGKGRVILAACEPGELAMEDDERGHGVFTYYLLKGLQGPADADSDGYITTDEIYGYLLKNVPDASNQRQHPVKRGEGIVTIGVIR